MDLRHDDDQNQFTTSFRRVKLPRIVRSAYPRSPDLLLGDWTARAGLLVALHMDQTVGYISLSLNIAPSSTWITDLVVHDRMRRKGIGSALVLASLEWARNHATRYLILVMQPKNYPAIKLAQKFGFDFAAIMIGTMQIKISDCSLQNQFLEQTARSSSFKSHFWKRPKAFS